MCRRYGPWNCRTDRPPFVSVTLHHAIGIHADVAGLRDAHRSRTNIHKPLWRRRHAEADFQRPKASVMSKTRVRRHYARWQRPMSRSATVRAGSHGGCGGQISAGSQSNSQPRRVAAEWRWRSDFPAFARPKAMYTPVRGRNWPRWPRRPAPSAPDPAAAAGCACRRRREARIADATAGAAPLDRSRHGW